MTDRPLQLAAVPSSKTAADLRQRIPDLCAMCHSEARSHYLASVHRVRQVRDAPILLQKSADFCDKICTKLSIAEASAN